MTDPLPQPIRVLVKGASTVVWTSWMGGPRSDYTFARVIESELLAAGIPAEVRCTAVPAERVKVALKHWDEEILPWSPDVVVMHYGHMETIHKLLPHWFERHAHSLHKRTGRARAFYRKHVIRGVYMTSAHLQAAVDRRLPPTSRLFFNPERVAADLGHLIERIRSIQSPLVIALDTNPPSKNYQEWFPGMSARIEVMNEEIARVVEGFDHPDVRMFKVTELIRKQFGDYDPSPDGAHYTPEVYFAIGQALAAQIIAWRATQPHLLDWNDHPLHKGR
jgi:hypothetical protein